MNHEKIIECALYTPGGLNLVFTGPPGVGKTATMEAIAKRTGYHLETVILSLCDPTDVAGLPFLINGASHRAPPKWVQAAMEKPTIVFLDELSTAPPSVQNVALRIVQDRYVGDTKLPEHTRFIAAQNSLEDTAIGYAMSAPLANRFCHLTWPEPNVQAWSQWLLTQGTGDDDVPGDPMERLEEVREKYKDTYVRTRGYTVSFLSKNRSRLMQQPPANDTQGSKGWPSPRSWDNAIRALATAEAMGLGDVEKGELLSGFVGPGAAKEFFTHMKMKDLPDPADVLDGKVKWKLNKKRTDQAMAVLCSCAALIVSTPEEERSSKQFRARIKQMYQTLKEVSEAKAIDLALIPMRTLAAAKLVRNQSLNMDEETFLMARDLFSKLYDVKTETETAMKAK